MRRNIQESSFINRRMFVAAILGGGLTLAGCGEQLTKEDKALLATMRAKEATTPLTQDELKTQVAATVKAEISNSATGTPEPTAVKPTVTNVPTAVPTSESTATKTPTPHTFTTPTEELPATPVPTAVPKEISTQVVRNVTATRIQNPNFAPAPTATQVNRIFRPSPTIPAVEPHPTRLAPTIPVPPTQPPTATPRRPAPTIPVPPQERIPLRPTPTIP